MSTIGWSSRNCTRRSRHVEAYGQVIRSPWEDLRHGLVLAGDALWDKLGGLIDEAKGVEKIHWRRRADGEETSRMIASLDAQEADVRVGIWLRVRMGGERMNANHGMRSMPYVRCQSKRSARATLAPLGFHDIDDAVGELT